MKTQRATGLVLMAGTALLSLGMATTAYATDLNKLVDTCTSCHGKDGISTEPTIPIIAGYSAVYIHDNMLAYKNKERPCPENEFRSGPQKGQKSDMCKITKDMSEDDINQVAKHFAGLKFVPATQKFDAALAAKGKKLQADHCDKCHSEGGSVAGDDAGILAGQWMPYLRSSFKEFKSGERVIPKKMKPKFEKLGDDDIEALLNLFASAK